MTASARDGVDGFAVGDAVEWTSQAGGHYKTKRGVVAAIVPPNVHPKWIALDGNLSRSPMDGTTMTRRHQSYIVRVKRTAYWPRVCQLRLERLGTEPAKEPR